MRSEESTIKVCGQVMISRIVAEHVVDRVGGDVDETEIAGFGGALEPC